MIDMQMSRKHKLRVKSASTKVIELLTNAHGSMSGIRLARLCGDAGILLWMVDMDIDVEEAGGVVHLKDGGITHETR